MLATLPVATCSRHVEQLLTQALLDGLVAGQKFAQWLDSEILYVGRKGSYAVWACPGRFNTACYTGYSEFYGDRDVERLNASQPLAKKHSTILFGLKFWSWVIPEVKALGSNGESN